MKYRYKHIVLCFLCMLTMQGMGYLYGQDKEGILNGEVSYITGQNIYVKFANTQGIENGDTLFVPKDEKRVPALIVKHRSSMSCLCNPIGNSTFKVGDRLLAVLNDKASNLTKETEKVEQDVNEEALAKVEDKYIQRSPESDFSGRLSFSSYSTFADGSKQDNSHRFRYRLLMDAKNISNSKLSAETYLSFTHKSGEWNRVGENLNDALKVYALALKYDFSPNATLWAGRKINPRIANVGAVDGLQFQQQWKSLYAGAVVGSRPDYQDYGYNPDLLQYGAYVGHQSKVNNGFAQSSFAFFEQRNSGHIDRRFMYFQHSNSLVKDVVLFSSVEVDLYKVVEEEKKNEWSLTALYLSLSYRASRKLSLFGSYDNRKNVIYYETFRNFVDEMIHQSSRQGYRFRLNYRPIKYMNLNFSAGTRSRKEDPRANNTYSASAGYSRLPYVNASFTLTGNVMQTSYLDGRIVGGRLSKNLLEGKLYATLSGRWVRFDYVNTVTQLKQQISELDLSYYFNKKLYLSVNLETTFQENNNYQRIYLNLRKKF